MTAKPLEFDRGCGSASLVLLNSAYVNFDLEDDALLALGRRLLPGTVLLVLGVKRVVADVPCTPGLLPLSAKSIELTLNEELGLTSSLSIFVVAPREASLQQLVRPELRSVAAAVRLGACNISSEVLAVAGRLKPKATGHDAQGKTTRPALDSLSLRSVVDVPRFRRLRFALNGLAHVGGNGTLRPLAAPLENGVPLWDAARWFLARALGHGPSPYSCLEDEVYAQAPLAPQIPHSERALFPSHTGTYGEVDPRGIALLLEHLGGLNRSDVFADLGSGLGKVTLQVFLGTDARSCIGVELSRTRHERAADALTVLRRRFPELDERFRSRSLDFVHSDILKANLTNATVVWMGSLAFTPELMASVAGVLLDQVPLGCHVVSMLEFPKHAVERGGRRLVRRDLWYLRVRWSPSEKGGKAYHFVVEEGT